MIRRHTIYTKHDYPWSNHRVRMVQGYNLKLNGGYDKVVTEVWVEPRSGDRPPRIRINSGVNGSSTTEILNMDIDEFFECILPEYNITFTKRSEDGQSHKEEERV